MNKLNGCACQGLEGLEISKILADSFGNRVWLRVGTSKVGRAALYGCLMRPLSPVDHTPPGVLFCAVPCCAVFMWRAGLCSLHHAPGGAGQPLVRTGARGYSPAAQ